MSKRVMWFGTKQFSRWVKVATPGPSYVQRRMSDRLDYANGGVGVRQSFGSGAERSLTWNVLTPEQASDITDYAYGVYGPSLVYWVDPVVAERNMLNPSWSAPGLALKDAIPLAGRERPIPVVNSDMSLGYPYDMARYVVTASTEVRKFYIPIPPGKVAWVGAHGDPGSTLGLSVQPVTAGAPAGAPSIVPVTSTGSKQRVTRQFSPTGEQSGIEISIQRAAGYVTLAGVIVQVLPAGVAPQEGGFILGEGTSGCTITEPQVSPQRVDADRNGARSRVGLSVKMIETEEWL